MLDMMEIQSDMVPYLSRETDAFTDCFKFGSLEVMIPFERLDQQDILQSIDLTYYLSECRRILKMIYDNSNLKNCVLSVLLIFSLCHHL